jgi:hypothetical protein
MMEETKLVRHFMSLRLEFLDYLFLYPKTWEELP